MSKSVKVACIQNCASPDLAANLAETRDLTREAAAKGAQLICLPEYFSARDVENGRLKIQVPLPRWNHDATYTVVANVTDDDSAVPVLGNNTLTIDEDQTVVLTGSNLSATDADTPDASLTTNGG